MHKLCPHCGKALGNYTPERRKNAHQVFAMFGLAIGTFILATFFWPSFLLTVPLCLWYSFHVLHRAWTLWRGGKYKDHWQCESCNYRW